MLKLAMSDRQSESLALLLGRIGTILPEGRPLAPAVWNRRHRGITILVWAHAAGLLLEGLLLGDLHSLSSGAIGGAILSILAVVAARPILGRRVRATANSLALLAASAFLVHLSGGYIEMHFHFFVSLAVIALYQDWIPFLAAIGFVLVEHGVVGVLFPSSVYNHPAALAHPWAWAGLHALFVAAASATNLLAWRLSEHQALHDPLTGLANRTLFRDRVEHARSRARRRSDAIAVVFVDLDRFKPVNDTFGHDAGDRVLVAVAERLREAVRANDTVARLGGDEFALLLEDIADVSDVTRLARRVLDGFREPIQLWGRPDDDEGQPGDRYEPGRRERRRRPDPRRGRGDVHGEAARRRPIRGLRAEHAVGGGRAPGAGA